MSVICWYGSVFAIRSGIINGTKLDTLASPSNSSGNGCFSRIEKASLPLVISSSVAASSCPSASRAIQRRSEVTQSAPRTGSPS